GRTLHGRARAPGALWPRQGRARRGIRRARGDLARAQLLLLRQHHRSADARARRSSAHREPGSAPRPRGEAAIVPRARLGTPRSALRSYARPKGLLALSLSEGVAYDRALARVGHPTRRRRGAPHPCRPSHMNAKAEADLPTLLMLGKGDPM